MTNELIIASAGSGKTTFLINKALSIPDSSILITTYTESNAKEIKNKFIESVGYVPPNVHVLTWFSFLIKQCIKPYQTILFDYKIKGLILVNKKSGIRYTDPRSGREIPYAEGDNFEKFYFTKNKRIYSDKVAKLAIRVNTETKGKIINRITEIYDYLLIDECQDLAGYDLEILKTFAQCKSNLSLVCDPRQVTYLTHNSTKYKKYRNGLLKDFITTECKKSNFTIDETSLSKSYRCNKLICDFANKLYPEHSQCGSKETKETDHDGVFILSKDMINDYLEKYNPVQLRWNSTTKNINTDFSIANFGQSKGLTFERVLIFPTKGMLDWIKDDSISIKKFSNEARAKFYVGLTRAKYSVGIVSDEANDFVINGTIKYE